jgi:hypothetical protein
MRMIDRSRLRAPVPCIQPTSAPAQGTIPTEYAESRADHGLENFGDSLYPYGKYGRHVGTRTPDLYRVKAHLFNPFNNLNHR